jgi:hypothetical protein
MHAISIQDIKTKGAKVLDENEPNFLIINSKLKYCITPIEQYNMLIEALEELEDIRAIEQSIGAKTYSMDEVSEALQNE